MWLRFKTIQGNKASVQINKADYAQLLRRFSVDGAEADVECPFCENMDCDICPIGRLEKDIEGYWYGCSEVVPGLNNACDAAASLYCDKKYGVDDKRRHRKNVRILRNFRNGIMRAARSKKPDDTSTKG